MHFARWRRIYQVLFILGLVVIAVIVVTCLTIGRNNQDNGYGSLTDPSAIALDSSSDIVKINYVYGENKVNLTYDAEKDTWSSDDDASFPLDQRYPKTMISSLEDIAAQYEFSEYESLAAYGLKEPDLVVTLTDADGKQSVYSFGDYNEGSDGYYMMSDSGTSIYLVNSSLHDIFAKALSQLAEMEEIPDIKSVWSMSIKGSGKNVYIEYNNDGAYPSYTEDFCWFIRNSDNSFTAIDETKAQELISSVTTLKWASLYDYNADDAAKKKYKVADDNYNLLITLSYPVTTEDENGKKVTSNKDFQLYVGTGDDIHNYARLAGSDYVYLIDTSVYKGLNDAGYSSLRSDMVISMDWNTVDKMEIVCDGTTHTLQFVRDKESGSVSYLLDNKALAPVNVEPFLEQLTALKANGYGEPENAGSSAMTITFYRNTSTFKEMKLTLAKYDEDNYLLSFYINDDLLIAKKHGDALISSFKSLLDND